MLYPTVLYTSLLSSLCLTKPLRGAQIDALPPLPPRALHGAGARVDVGLLVTKHGHAEGERGSVEDGDRGSVADGERGSAPSCSSERTSRPSARWSRSADTSRSAGTFCGARTTRPPAAIRTAGGRDFW